MLFLMLLATESLTVSFETRPFKLTVTFFVAIRLVKSGLPSLAP